MSIILDRWGTIIYDSSKIEQFNNNMDKIEKEFLGNTQDIYAANKRIDNLILNVSGNDITEVVDARVNANGTIYPTLKAKLDAFERTMAAYLADVNTEIGKVNDTAKKLEDQLKALYGATEANLEIYVDASKGNDTSGTGASDAPYKTINKAVQQIPRALNGSAVYIYLVPGIYNEDVYILNKQISAIYIQGTNTTNTIPKDKQTGVFVRHLNFRDCSGYLSVRGLNQIGADQLPDKAGTIMFTRCGYASVGFCRFDDAKAKTNSVPAVIIDSGIGGAHNCYFLNQYAAQLDQYMAYSNFAYTNEGTGNTYSVISDASIVQINPPNKVAGSTLVRNGGMLS
ncbi:hypothetical protein [Listeria booriae]|uniref:hypothetical protein n=1 Tax=Listeria booriae TaxID=1552123 RepID=UPI0016253D1C|nr:hypothetical protein [Listeria booriae]MBC1230557.1 cell wall metabolism sensor histidine kinase WalK [Listeria booriae]MBC1233622.1 cell wall metabolism sensor histidine kinase WalK [Listeria booriae]MBC1801061.1 cell wall metabolism sensor histidine kinase WalK [Listeria booriae]